MSPPTFSVLKPSPANRRRILQNPPPIYEDRRNASVPHQERQEPAPDRQLGSPLSSTNIASSSSSSSGSKKRKATTGHDHRAPALPAPAPPKDKNTEFLEAQDSIDLNLAPPDPFEIKKTLEESDLDSGLTLPKEAMEKHVLPYWRVANKGRPVRFGKDGIPVKLWDKDEQREHVMKLKMIQLFNSNIFVLTDKWASEIVRDRELEKGDQIGLCWDSIRKRFDFSVLQRHQVPVQEEH